MINIAIADDHQLIREGLKRLAAARDDIEVAWEANDLPSALDQLGTTSVDVLILDLSLNDSPDIKALLAVRAAFPAVPTLVLSMYSEERFAVQALKAGAAGYICKATAADDVITGIRKIAQGGRYVSPLVAELLAKELSSPAAAPLHELLTARERQVFGLLGAGMPIKQVAAELELSISSVNTYRVRIFQKMGLQSNAALIRYAIKHDLAS